RGALRETGAKADCVSAGPPASDQVLHCSLHLQNHPHAEQCRLGSRHRRVQQKHQTIGHKTGQRSLVLRDDGAERLVILLQQTHDLVRLGVSGEGSETAQVAKTTTTFARWLSSKPASLLPSTSSAT